MTNNMKKDLQKVVKMFRDSRPDVKGYAYNFETKKYEETMVRSDFPKAMMTGQQISKGTATINCGSSVLYDINQGESILAPACIHSLDFKGDATIITATV